MLLLYNMLTNKAYTGIIILSVLYAAAYFITALLIGKKDMYEGYIGFNYHLTTYVVCITVPIVLATIGYLPEHFIEQALSMGIFWGIGLTIHFIVFMINRKKNIKGYDKTEVFE
ncbi:hypothetical protein CAP35_11445 [Chitinophagaceae bacterium IBVUCB1]|nr:hypothetical protein CAP35_11445 [Chitinophagaceae bacterium IBVUCB1]